METVDASGTEVKKNRKSKRNGSSNGAEEPTVSEQAPQEIKLDREDILSLNLITEKSRRLEAESGRIAAERRSLENENLLYVRSLNDKYDVDMNGYQIDLDAGIARPRADG